MKEELENLQRLIVTEASLQRDNKHVEWWKDGRWRDEGCFWRASVGFPWSPDSAWMRAEAD